MRKKLLTTFSYFAVLLPVPLSTCYVRASLYIASQCVRKATQPFMQDRSPAHISFIYEYIFVHDE